MWAKTVFILNYDEHGGFFDHQLPPVPPLAAGRGASTVSVDGEVGGAGVQGRLDLPPGGRSGRPVPRQERGRQPGLVRRAAAGETLVAGPFPMGLGVRVRWWWSRRGPAAAWSTPRCTTTPR
ncbi:alkaline phosphatase family protein [Kitasatospora cheerisanensis]|uniref:alkaline phosphatase family protein n=1 Tax=Kitasatospora cheerisanensis TaxID=81942 RepID=UPI003CC60D51